MVNNARYKPYTIFLVIGYVLFLSILVIIRPHISAPDTYYYWQWSRHLEWSYYDGPPMIAYILRMITTLFSSSPIALQSLGIYAVLITSYYLYQIAQLLFKNERIGFISVLIWLLTAGTSRHFFMLITYDTVLIIFWALTFYYYLKLLLTQRSYYYYLTGIGIGLMLLSKYTGILLCGAMFISCLVYAPYRFVFKNKHFYAALLIACFIFSPVLYWNYDHQWIAFSFQWHHGIDRSNSFLFGICAYLKNVLISFNIAFLCLLGIFFKKGVSIFKDSRVGLLAIPSILVFLFFLVTSLHGTSMPGWNAPFFFTASLLLGYFAIRLNIQRFILISYFLVSIVFLFAYVIVAQFRQLDPTPPSYDKPKAVAYMIHQLPKNIFVHRILYVDSLSGGYVLSAIIDYFLQGYPNIYVTQSWEGHQYYFRNLEDHPAKTGDSILLLADHPLISDPHFTKCQQIFHVEDIVKNIILRKTYRPSLYVFNCYYQNVKIAV